MCRLGLQGFIQGYTELHSAARTEVWKSISIIPRGVGSFQVRLECEGLFEKSEEPGSHPGLRRFKLIVDGLGLVPATVNNILL